MKWINKSVLGIFFILISLTRLSAQEELGNLWNRSETGNYLTKDEGYASESIPIENDTTIHYLFNPIDLPIRDDFSKNKIKHFVTDTNDPSVFDSLSYSFLVNNGFVDTLKYVRDTVYNYVFNPSTKNLDSSIAPILKVDFYHDTLNPFRISDFWLVFPSFSTYTQNGITKKIFYQEDSLLLDTAYKHYFAKDDANSLWINEGAFWNITMSIDPPTIGVITFDGLNNSGKPYDNSSRLTYGNADKFLSKPINLYGDRFGRYTSSDSVYLSFFIQPHGNGDRPEEEDSLLLEFYSPVEGRWSIVWSNNGDTLQDFRQIFIHIADTVFLQVGFQFRFRNYSTLSGNFDHWHLDYIQLDKDRKRNEVIKDFAFTEPIRTMLKLYTSVPWTHYNTAPQSYINDVMLYKLRNLGDNTDFGNSDYQVTKNGESNPFFKSVEELTLSVPASDTFSVKHFVNSGQNNFKFPIDTNQRQLFKAKLRFSATDDDLRENDTLVHFQLFDRFYSYDDCSAEKTYHLNLTGTSVVVEFKTPIADTLRSVMINFVETFEPPSNQKINIVVYKDLKDAPFYESGPVDVIYNPEGEFYRYNIDPALVDGTFYVGYQQLDQNKTFLGYDVNFNNQDRTFISQIDGQWSNSIFLGTTMIRASFGRGDEKPLAKEEVTEGLEIVKFYPNPAQDWIYFKEDINDEIEIYSISGKLEHREFVSTEINISHLPNGFYLIKRINKKTTKLLIAR